MQESSLCCRWTLCCCILQSRDTVALQGRSTNEAFQSSLEHFYWVIHELRALMVQMLLNALHPNTTFLEEPPNTHFIQTHKIMLKLWPLPSKLVFILYGPIRCPYHRKFPLRLLAVSVPFLCDPKVLNLNYSLYLTEFMSICLAPIHSHSLISFSH